MTIYKKKNLTPLTKKEMQKAQALSKRINEIFYEGNEAIHTRLSALVSLCNYWALVGQVMPDHLKEFFEFAAQAYEKDFQKAFENTPLNFFMGEKVDELPKDE